jgi:SNF2 family DNA or RNA helicase
MQLIDDVALRLTLPTAVADKALARIPKSEVLQDHGHEKEVLVYWGHSEAELLSYYLDGETSALSTLPSPIMRDYNWPGIFTPFDHQKTTASFLSLRRRAFCFNEAGTGKTGAAIWAADYLMTLGLVKRVLIICPMSIMYSAWQADVFNTAMHRTAAVAHGEAFRRKKIILGDSEFVIINYDGIPIVQKEIQDAKFDLIIIDEANAYKNASTTRWKTLAKIIAPSTWLWMMTGTPASQSPEDAFGLARMVSPGRVPKFKTAWRDLVMRQVGPFRWINKPTAQRDVYEALQPAIRFTKKECLDLPEVTYQTRDIPMTPQVAKYYNQLRKEFLIEAGGEEVSAINAAAKMSKLLQISGGAVYTDTHAVIEFDLSPRFAALREVLDETVNKVVIFVPFLHTIGIVADYLTREGFTNEVICGDVPPKTRTAITDRFQRQQDPRVLVMQPQSTSHGLTLTAADTMVFWSPVTSVETYIQCIGRIDRVGQQNPMTVVHLQSSDVEKQVYRMLQGKVDSHMKLVDLYKQVLEGA